MGPSYRRIRTGAVQVPRVLVRQDTQEKKPAPELSYIVSAWGERSVTYLPVLLHSLRCDSSFLDWDVLVTDNTESPSVAAKISDLVTGMNDTRFRYLNTAKLIPLSDCYYSAEFGAKQTTGKYLSFPCDDCYYVPYFARKMVGSAYENGWHFVVVGQPIIGPDADGFDHYKIVKQGTGRFPCSKAEFIVKREAFLGFPGKPTEPGSNCQCDRLLGVELMKRVPWGVVPEPLVCHN